MRALMCLCFCLAAPVYAETAVMGDLSFNVPQGWHVTRDKSTLTGSPDKPAAGFAEFVWSGPFTDNGNDPGENLSRYLENTFKGFTVLNTKSFKLTLDAGFMNIGMQAVVRQGNDTYFTVSLAVQALGSLYFFTYDADSETVYKTFLQTAFPALMQSLRAQKKEPGPSNTDTTTLAPSYPAAWTRIFEFNVPIPRDWKTADKATTSNVRLLRAPAGVTIKGYRDFPVVMGLYAGKPAQPENEIKAWAEGVFMSTAHDLFNDQVKLDKQVSASFGPANGTYRGYVFKTTHTLFNLLHSVSTVVMVVAPTHTVLLGISYEHSENLTGDEARQLLARMDKLEPLLKEMAVSTGYAAQTRYPTWEQFLVNRRTWHYDRDSSLGQLSTIQVVNVAHIFWEFKPGPTCLFKSSSFSGMGISVYDYNSGRYLRTESSDQSSLQELRGSFQVRGGAENDLWIVMYPANGMAVFYRFIPDDRGRFGDQAIRGISIGGKIEGTYTKADGMLFWKP